MIGPVEYRVVEFPGSQLKGEIVLAHIELTERATIRIIDLLNEEDTRMLRVLTKSIYKSRKLCRWS